jgi:hypothetical protein
VAQSLQRQWLYSRSASSRNRRASGCVANHRQAPHRHWLPREQCANGERAIIRWLIVPGGSVGLQKRSRDFVVSGAWRTSCKAAQGEDLACDKIATFAATFEPAIGFRHAVRGQLIAPRLLAADQGLKRLCETNEFASRRGRLQPGILWKRVWRPEGRHYDKSPGVGFHTDSKAPNMFAVEAARLNRLRKKSCGVLSRP